MLECLQQQRIKPEKVITHRMDIESFMDGFEIMRDKREDYIKIMMTNEL